MLLRLVIALTAASLTAQEIAFPAGQDSVRLPLVMLSNGNHPGLPCIDVRIGDQKVLFLLDSGFGQTAIDKTLADDLGLEQRGSDIVLGIGNTRRTKLFRGPALDMGGVGYQPRLIYGLRLRNFAGKRRRPIQGLLGGEFFARCVLTIDYVGREVVIHEASSYEPPADAVEIRLSFSIAQPEVWGSIDGGRRFRFVVDTGAEAPLTLNGPFVVTHELIDEPERFPTVGIGGAAGTSQISIAEVERFALGALTTGPLPVSMMGSVADFALGGDKRRAGILGSGFFAGSRLTFDYKRRSLLIEVGDKELPQMRIGGLALRSEAANDHRIGVVVQWRDRPELDLLADDRLLSVDGKPVPSDARALYDLLCDQPETALLVERDGEQHEVSWPRIDRLPRVRLKIR